MRDSQHSGQGDRSSEDLSALARSVVARLIARDGAYLRAVDPEIVASLSRAFVSPEPAIFEALKPELRRARIGEIELVDSYFPAVARHLGCAWLEDRAGFAEVTVGVARMQAILRQIGRDWGSDTTAHASSQTALLVLPDTEQHSFGLFVLAGQLRRQGISIQIKTGARPAELAALVAQKRFDCAMISVACEEKLEYCKRLVKALKQGSEGRLWVAVGGAVLDRAVDVMGQTQADIATNDPASALAGSCQSLALPVRDVG